MFTFFFFLNNICLFQFINYKKIKLYVKILILLFILIENTLPFFLKKKKKLVLIIVIFCYKK